MSGGVAPGFEQGQASNDFQPSLSSHSLRSTCSWRVQRPFAPLSHERAPRFEGPSGPLDLAVEKFEPFMVKYRLVKKNEREGGRLCEAWQGPLAPHPGWQSTKDTHRTRLRGKAVQRRRRLCLFAQKQLSTLHAPGSHSSCWL